MTTYTATPKDIQQSWYLIDFAKTEKPLGRVATRIASMLRGKHKPTYTPHMDTGDYIVVINAEKAQVTGNKTTDKIYDRYTGYPGGNKYISFDKLQATQPERIIWLAVKGMLPKGPLGNTMLSKLKIYAGSDHPHTAQQPKLLEDI
jgi:large subunit ribosomal protein L13